MLRLGQSLRKPTALELLAIAVLLVPLLYWALGQLISDKAWVTTPTIGIPVGIVVYLARFAWLARFDQELRWRLRRGSSEATDRLFYEPFLWALPPAGLMVLYVWLQPRFGAGLTYAWVASGFAVIVAATSIRRQRRRRAEIVAQ